MNGCYACVPNQLDVTKTVNLVTSLSQSNSSVTSLFNTLRSFALVTHRTRCMTGLNNGC